MIYISGFDYSLYFDILIISLKFVTINVYSNVWKLGMMVWWMKFLEKLISLRGLYNDVLENYMLLTTTLPNIKNVQDFPYERIWNKYNWDTRLIQIFHYYGFFSNCQCCQYLNNIFEITVTVCESRINYFKNSESEYNISYFGFVVVRYEVSFLKIKICYFIL